MSLVCLAALPLSCGEDEESQWPVQQIDEAARQQIAPGGQESPLFEQALAAYEAGDGDRSVAFALTFAHERDGVELLVSVALHGDADGDALLAELEASRPSEWGRAWVSFHPDMAVLAASFSDLLADPYVLERDQAGEPLSLRFRISHGDLYVSIPEFDGWFEFPLDGDEFFVDEEFPDEELPQELHWMWFLSTFVFEAISPYVELPENVFDCVEAFGGSIVPAALDGEDIWQIECVVEHDTLDPETAAQFDHWLRYDDDCAVDLNRRILVQQRMALRQTDGAPLLFERQVEEAAAADQPEPRYRTTFTERLLAWNQPMALPEPTPLLELSALQDLHQSSGGAPNPELIAAEALLERALQWYEDADELHLRFRFSGTNYIEERISRRQVAYEYGSFRDDATIRLLWNRDGFWASGEELDGQPVWEHFVSTADLRDREGDDLLEIDDVLEISDSLGLKRLPALLPLATVSRVSAPDQPPRYELVFRSRPESADSDLQLLADFLDDETGVLTTFSLWDPPGGVRNIDGFLLRLMLTADGTVQTQTLDVTYDGGDSSRTKACLISEGPLEFPQPGDQSDP